jgi:hypothetical protein
MSKMANRPPAGQSWIWLTKEMMKSDAWRSAGINCRRVIDFLLVEFMEHGGRHNGELKAPYRQLVTIGIPKDCVTSAIREAEALGLVDCHRGGMRVAATFGLTWLPLHDGTAASDRWRQHRDPSLKPWPAAAQKD